MGKHKIQTKVSMEWFGAEYQKTRLFHCHAYSLDLWCSFKFQYRNESICFNLWKLGFAAGFYILRGCKKSNSKLTSLANSRITPKNKLRRQLLRANLFYTNKCWKMKLFCKTFSFLLFFLERYFLNAVQNISKTVKVMRMIFFYYYYFFFALRTVTWID